MQVAGQGADFLVQQPLDERVHVLVGGARGGAVSQPLGDAVQPLEQLRFFRRRQHPRTAQGVNPGLARRDVLRPEPVVHRETAVQGVERLAGAEGEAPAPHLADGGRGRGCLGPLVVRGGAGWRHQSAAAAPIVGSR